MLYGSFLMNFPVYSVAEFANGMPVSVMMAEREIDGARGLAIFTEMLYVERAIAGWGKVSRTKQINSNADLVECCKHIPKSERITHIVVDPGFETIGATWISLQDPPFV